jgi:hypothetical protein
MAWVVRRAVPAAHPFSNPREASFQEQELCHFPPLARVAEIGQVKALVPRVLKSGKA